MAGKATYEELEQQVREMKRSAVWSDLDLLENLPLGISISSPEGLVVDINLAGLRMFGYASKEAFLKMKASDHYYNPEDRELFKARNEKGTAKDFETQLVKKDGTVFWAAITSMARPVHDKEGTYYLNIFQDISARKAATERAEHLDRVLRAIRKVDQLITRETDRDRLLKGICDSLIETRGYYNVWIAVLDEKQRLQASAESGVGKKAFMSLVQQMRQGHLTLCGQKVLSKPGIEATLDPISNCADCPLAGRYKGRGAMTIRLENEKRVYGFMSASIPSQFISDTEEQDLFQQVASDIAYALQAASERDQNKQAEVSLKRSEKLLTDVFNSIQDGVSILDENLNIVMVNTIMDEWYAAHAPLKGKKCYECYQNADKPCDPCPSLACLQSGKNESEIVKGLPGSYAEWIELFAHPVIDHESGKMGGVVEFVRNITGRKRAEEALRESEFSFSQMFEQSTTSTCLYNPDGTIKRVNNEFCKMFGVEEKVIINAGYNVFKDQAAIDAGTIPFLRDIFEKKKRQHWETNFDIDIASASTGTPTSRTGKIFLEVFGYPVLNREGNLEYVVLQHYDISERKQSEATLRESENRLRATLDAAAFPVVIVDTNDDQVHFWSRSAHSLFGHTASSASEWYELAYPDPEYRRQVIDRWKSFLDIARESGQLVNTGEYNVTCKDGSVRICEIYATFLTDNLIVTFNDITDQKNAEAERETLQRQLAQSRKMESIGTLAGGIAHDFNNILGIIVGNTELALNDVPEWSPARSNLSEIVNASVRARDMVRQILAFSRRTEQQKKPLRLGIIIQDTLKMLRASIPTTVEFREEILTGADTVMADPTQINQILLNLSTNAAHAMQEKGGVLCVRLENRTLDENASKRHLALKPGAWVVMTVSDTGHGISPEILERIFDPYFTTKDVGEGTGMGLSVVHGIIQNHRGALLVRSEPGLGADFEIYLPFLEEEADLEKETASPLPTGTERILVVDDEEPLALLVTRMLEHLQYDVTMTTSSLNALELFREKPDQFNLVITDMTMPHLPGTELSLELMRIRQDIPVILCTGFSERISEAQAENLGIRTFLEKPLSMRVLAETVRKVLDEESPS